MEDIPPFDKVDKIWDEDKLREKLEIPAEEKVADYYYHYAVCTWAVLEAKSSKIGSALRQLETTVDKLMKKGHRVDMVIIVLDKLSTLEKKRFLREEGSFRLFEKRGKIKIPITIKGHNVLLIRREEFRTIAGRKRGLELWVYM